MLRILSGQTEKGIGRRTLLQAGAAGALGLSLPHIMRTRTQAGESESGIGLAPPKSVILLWLWGGPSHLDTFDMKPMAQSEYRGPFVPVPTNVPGMEICELLPRLARQADKYAIIRSMHHDSNDHGISGTIGLTGSSAGAISLGGLTLAGRVEPTAGAIIARARGFRPAVPSFATLGGHLHQGKKPINGEGGGTLGTQYDPFRLDYDPVSGIKLPELELIDGLSANTLGTRQSLLAQLDRQATALDQTRTIGKLDQFYQQAFSLLTSGNGRKVFDLEQESAKLRTQYGRFRFGQCCLLARRLVEAGVSFVQVNWSSHVEPVEDGGDGGWDMHDRNFIQMQDRHAWMLDQSMSALLSDLESRGLLETTLVIGVGEFGRTPKINNRAGRDHWQNCYSAVIAGGGVRGGQIIGSSDKLAEFPASRPLTPADLNLTILRQLGIGTAELTGFGLTPGAEVIEELL
jgi:uncharacterized protein (DUF1501 family)